MTINGWEIWDRKEPDRFAACFGFRWHKEQRKAMEIRPSNGANRANQVYFRKAISKLKAAGISSSDRSDEVEISDIGRFLSYLSQLPDVRQDRIEALRGQIERDEYDVESKIEEIVDDILNDLGIPQTEVNG